MSEEKISTKDVAKFEIELRRAQRAMSRETFTMSDNGLHKALVSYKKKYGLDELMKLIRNMCYNENERTWGNLLDVLIGKIN